MKTVIYKMNVIYYTTTKENYEARFQNAHLIHKMEDFNDADEIIEYYCEHFGSKYEDFIVIKKHEEIVLEQIQLLHELGILNKKNYHLEAYIEQMLNECHTEIQIINALHDVKTGKITVEEMLRRKWRN